MNVLSIRAAGIFGLLVLAALTPESSFAQTGVMAFRDDCTGLLYAMRGDSSGRVALPLPPRPLPTDRYESPLVLDVTTTGPTTVVYYVAITRIVMINGQNVLTTVDQGLFAVQVDDIGGSLTPELPVRLTLPAVAGVDPNNSHHGSFSAFGAGDRLALVSSGAGASVLLTARVERDSTSRIISLSDLVAVGDLYSIGMPDTTFPTGPGFTGFIDYAPDGRSIVASIYYDLWMVHLRDDNTFLSAERLTENTEGFAEWNPAFSPDGGQVAYVSGAIDRTTGGVRDPDIYTLVPATRVAQQVTTNSNRGDAVNSRNNPMWSADGASIGFSAYVSRTHRRSPCASLVNSEIFLISADGSTIATPITNTNGTSVEAWPKWGW